MLAARPDELQSLAEDIRHSISSMVPAMQVEYRPDSSFAGGGSLPTVELATWVVTARHPSLSSGMLADGLRRLDVPIICRVNDDALVFDCRTLTGGDADQLAAALADVVRELSPAG